MISAEYRCIFVHIPKTGGTSIEDIFWPDRRELSEDPEWAARHLWMSFVDEFRNKYQTGGLQHLTADQIATEVGTDTFNECFKFAIVRNPWDKAISQFTYTKNSRPDLRQYLGMSSSASFHEYLDLVQHKEHVQWTQQSSFLCDAKGDLAVDFVGRFEEFDAAVREICRRLRPKKLKAWVKAKKIQYGVQAVPFSNKSSRGHYTTYYDSDTRDLVANIYARDIDLFDYEFGR